MTLCDSKTTVFSRVALGSAQLGMDYGVANHTGRPSEESARALVASAVAQGLDWFDTAAVYGESEAVLGRIFAALGIQDQVNVVSKGGGLATSGEPLTTQVTASLQRLGLPRLAAWLLHAENDLSAWDERASDEAQALCAANRVGSFGLSAYQPETALRAVEELGLTSVQFPASPLDRRFLRHGVAGRLASAGAELYVRSVYLQGLCLMEPADVPAHIFRGRKAAQTLADFCARHGFARDHFCVQYVLQRTAATGARLVIGMERDEQLVRNAAILAAPAIDAICLDEWDSLWPDDVDDLVLPFRWKAPR